MRTANTGAQGDYQFTDLLPGTYTVSFSAAGFAAYKQENVTFDINRQVRVDAAAVSRQVQRRR